MEITSHRGNKEINDIPHFKFIFYNGVMHLGVSGNTGNLHPKRHKKRILLIMIISAVLALSAEVINQINHAKTENELIYQIKYIKDRLFKVADSIVMATPKQPEQPPAPVPQSVGAIGIVSPEDGAAVPDQAIVKGFASDTKSKVWVIVHPTETGAYWVQPAVELRKDGKLDDPGLHRRCREQRNAL